jgi:hypothetical protein
MAGLEEAVHSMTLKTQREMWIESMIARADANAQELGFVDSRARAAADATSGADGDAAAIDAFIRSGCCSEAIGSSGRTAARAADDERSVKRWLLVRGLLIEGRHIGEGGANTPFHRVLAASVGTTAALGRVALFLSVESKAFSVARVGTVASRLQRCADAAVQLRAATELRQLLSITDPPISEVISTGVVPVFTNFLTYDSQPQLQLEAAWALTSIASGTSDHARTVNVAGAIPTLVQLFKAQLHSDDPEVQLQSVTNFRKLLSIKDNSIKDFTINTVILSGVVPTFVDFLKHESQSKLQHEAACALANIASGDDQRTVARAGAIPMLVQLFQAQLHSGDPEAQQQSVTNFRNLLSIQGPAGHATICEVISSGVVPTFVDFLKCESQPQLQFEAAWALTNITSGTSDHTHTVIDAGAVPMFVQLLSSPSDDVREQAAWALGNIAGDSTQCRDFVLHTGALAPLLSQLSTDSKLTMLRNATWTLSNFCRGKPQPALELIKPALPTLAELVYSADQKVLTDACWALSYFVDGSNDRIQAVVDSGVCARLVELLVHPFPPVQLPALRTVGNIATGDDVQTQVLLDYGMLPLLLSLMSSPKNSIRKQACFTISNITAGNSDQIQCVIEDHLIEPLIEVLSEDDFDIKKEAAWAISNATSGGTPDQIKHLVTRGCIRPLCDLQGCPDGRLVAVALEGLENILKTGRAEVTEIGRASCRERVY